MQQSDKKNAKRSNKRFYQILLFVFVIALVIVLIFMGKSYIAQKQAQNHYEELAGAAVTNEDTETVTDSTQQEDILAERGIVVPEKNLDWEALQSENEDIYAWIYIPNTQVDYPILQHPTEADYYLDHNLDDSTGYPGCIYSQNPSSKEFMDPLTVLYGHNMKNGTMFGSLHEFEDNEFFEQNSYIYIYTPEKTLVYEIFSACEFSDAHLMYTYNFGETSGFNQFVDDVSSVRAMNAHVRSDVEVEYGDYLLTLSTCIKNKSENRWLVTAVLVNKPENE